MWRLITNQCSLFHFCYRPGGVPQGGIGGLNLVGERASFPTWERRPDRPMDRGKGPEDDDDSAILIPFHEVRRHRPGWPVHFDRRELDLILRLYGRMVAANEWRDYAIDSLDDRAIFSVYRRASETPLFQIVKNPSLARRQGAWSVVSGAGVVLKRGQELARVLGVFDAKLKLVGA